MIDPDATTTDPGTATTDPGTTTTHPGTATTHPGTATTDPDELIALGRECWRQARETGGEDAALVRAVEALTRARAALSPGDPRSPAVSADLGKLLGVRYLTAGGSAADRDFAITVLTEVTRAEDVDQQTLAVTHALLGLLSMLGIVQVPSPVSRSVEDLFLDPPQVTDVDTDEAAADLARARTSLRDAEEIDGGLPDELRGFARLSRMAADLLEQAGGAFDVRSAGDLMERALADVSTSTPGHAELVAITEWLHCTQRLENGEPAAELVTEVEEVVRPLGDGHLLRPMLLAEFAADVGRLAESRGYRAEDVTLARDLLGKAWEGMRLVNQHPLWEQTLRRTAGITLVDAAMSGDMEMLDRAQELAKEVTHREDSDGGDASSGDRFLAGMADLMGAYHQGRSDDYDTAIKELARATGQLGEDHELWPIALAMLGATLSDEWLRRGDLESAEAAAFYMRLARARIQPGQDPANADLLVIRGLGAIIRLVHGVADDEELHQVIDELTTALDKLPEHHMLRPRMLNGLGMARMFHAVRADGFDEDEIRTAAGLLVDAADQETTPTGRPGMTVASGLGLLLSGVVDGDPRTRERGLARLDSAIEQEAVIRGEGARIRHGVGAAHLSLFQMYGDGGHLEVAIAHLGAAYEAIGQEPAHADSGRILSRLAEALRARDAEGDRPQAIDTGLRALRAFEDDVILQTGPEHGLAAARQAAGFAHQVARWCLDDGDLPGAVMAFERGRGLVLNAAAAAADVPETLDALGEPELAAEWRRTDAARNVLWTSPADGDHRHGLIDQLVSSTAGAPIPSDLRYRVLTALARADRRLLPDPVPAAIGAAVRGVGMDALVYLVPGTDRAVDRVLVLRDGAVTEVPLPDGAKARPPQDLPDQCRWAWSAVMGTLLSHATRWALGRDPRLVLVPLGTLGTIPWHAADAEGLPAEEAGTRRAPYACEVATLSYVASGRQLIEVCRRAARPPSADPVLVADPTLDLFWANKEIAALREAFYPFASVYGPLQPDHAGDGLPEEVRAHLPAKDQLGASLMHLAVHARTGATPTTSFLKLASPELRSAGTGQSIPYEELSVGEVLRQADGRPGNAPGALIVLSACESDATDQDHDEALTLATAFLCAGAGTVIATRWEVGDLRTAALTFVLHHNLRHVSANTADALRAAQRWMLDPRREFPATMPAWLREDLADRELRLDDPSAWAAFTHQGL